MPQHPVRPTNAILVSGQPIIEEYEVETNTNMYPGKFVIKGTSAEQVLVATDNSVAVIGILDVMPDKNLAKMYTDATPYAAGDQVRVIRGDCVVMARVDHSAVITVGLKVQVGDDGNVDQYATPLADVGISEEAFTGTGSPGAQADNWIMVHLTGV
jgi:hypothetical protein